MKRSLSKKFKIGKSDSSKDKTDSRIVRAKEKKVIKEDGTTEEGKEFSLSIEEGLRRVEDENRKLKSILKETRRNSTLFKLLAEYIEKHPPFSTFVPHKYINNKKNSITESAMLILSDSHGDQEILDKRVQGLEEYNFDVACRRAERIVDTTITHCLENMKGYNFETLYIAGLGDFVNGDIHKAVEHSKWHNSLKNAMGIGELFALMITDLSRYFPRIVFCSVPGNHGRRSLKKDYRAAQDNWDYLVAVHAATRLQGLIEEGRLTMVIPDSFSLGLDIYGWNFALNHGDDIRSWNSIPHYGIERKTRRLTSIGAITDKIPHYFLFGHFHNSSTLQHTTGETIINGSWAGTDEYALNSLGAYSEPYQWLMGVHPTYGLTWRLPIRLRQKDWKKEEKNTGRYSITLFEDLDNTVDGYYVDNSRKKLYV